MTRHLIVGVDAGTTAAVAALTFDGSVVGVKSGKELGLSSAVEYIMSLGKPSIIASDVDHLQELSSQLSKKFGIKLYTPEKSLTVNEKITITRGFHVSDSHQRDALAAALHAHSKHKNRLQKMSAQNMSDAAKHIVLQGNSITRSIQILAQKNPTPKPSLKPYQPLPQQSAEKKIISDLSKRVGSLTSIISEKDVELARLRSELEKTMRKKQKIVKVSKHTPSEGILQKISALERKASLLEMASAGDVFLVGVYPKVCCGITLCEQIPGDLSGIRVAFTSKSRIRELLLDKNIKVFDSKELKNEGGTYYIRAAALLEFDRRPPAVEQIISEYRRSRR